MTAIQTMTEATFDHDLTSAPGPILVDFWAEGCGPCKELTPMLEQLAAQHAGKLRVATVRLDDNPALARRFAIMALPTLIMFTDGRETKRITDVTAKAQLLEQLAAFLYY
jgi:thioredoxin 1